MGKILAWLLAAGKLGKVLTTGGTMLLSVITYAFFYGWKFAVGLVLQLFIHEMGHFVAARHKGLEVGLPTFIPFVGAWVELKNMPHNAETDAYIALAGPLAGALAAMGCYWLARETDSQLLLALAYVGFLMNLINLIPIMPLDGGHVTAAISPKIWLVGMPLLVLLFFYTMSPILLLVGVFAIPHFLSVFKNREEHAIESGRPQDYYQVTGSTRFNYALVYLGLTGFLATMCYGVYLMLHPGAGI